MNNSPRMIVPSLILAFGILAATALSVLLTQSGAWVLLGPLTLSAALIAAYFAQNSPDDPRRIRRSAAPMILGASFLIAGAIVALRDPTLVAQMIPILGCGGVAVILPEAAC